jgi:hypothetical protein
MTWRTQINEKGAITRYVDTDTGETISAREYQRRMQMQQGNYSTAPIMPGMYPTGAYPSPGGNGYTAGGIPPYPIPQGNYQIGFNQQPTDPSMIPSMSVQGNMMGGGGPNTGMAGTNMGMAAPNMQMPGSNMGPNMGMAAPGQTMPMGTMPGGNGSPLIQPGAQMLPPDGSYSMGGGGPQIASGNPPSMADQSANPNQGVGQGSGSFDGQPPTAGMPIQGKNLRLEGMPQHLTSTGPLPYRPHGFLDATSIAILLPTLVLLALVIAAAHKKRLFPWQTVRTFNPPSGLMTPREYERSFLCPPNLRRHGRIGKRNPNATWTEADGVVLPFGFLARTHLPVTIPFGRLPNKNMFIVAPTGSGKTTLMRAIIKALLAKPCVIIALEAKANDPNLDESKEGFKYTLLPEAQQAGFETLYFNPLDVQESIHWNPMDLSPIVFASSIVQDINTLEPEEQHWAERDHGYISGLAQLLKWGAVQVAGEDENGVASQVIPLPCNPRGLMRLVNNRRNIVESLRRLKNIPEVDAGELSELTQTLSSIIRTDTDWDKNIQGVRGRLRMFKNPSVLRVTESSNIDIRAAMHKPTVLIFGAPAALGPDAESLASCFVYQLQQALHTRYGTISVLPLFAFFDEYQTLNMDIAGRLSAIVRGANGGLTIMLQNVSQIARIASGSTDPGSSGASELKTIFSNAAIRICLHNADETTARFFSDEIGKHAVVVPGVADHFQAGGFGIFPSSWNRIHSQQVVARVDPDAIKRMEKHFALVYLAPAGDPEFGETKPFMVDLRGIEEIARLHLLHYVATRRPPGGEPAQVGGPQGAPAIGSPEGATHHGGAPGGAIPPRSVPAFASAASAAAQAVTASISGAHAPAASPPSVDGPTTTTERICSACGQPAGTRKFCIHCGHFLGGTPTGPVTADVQPRVELETSAKVVGTGQPISIQKAQPAVSPVAPQAAPVASGPPFPFARPQPVEEAPPVIEEPAPGGPLTRRSAFFDSPQRIADALQPPGGRERPPLTSLNPNLSNLGIPQPGAPSPARPEASDSKPRGVEF